MSQADFSELGNPRTVRVKRFSCKDDFDASIQSDFDLVYMLGFSNVDRKNGIKSRGEDDFLKCYAVYLSEEINRCQKDGDIYSVNILSKAMAFLQYVVAMKLSIKKNRSSFNQNQSKLLAKCKLAIRSIIVVYDRMKFDFAEAS